MRAALDRSKAFEIVLEDVLGEGPGAWDKDPRLPTRRANCIVWLQSVLAEYFAGNDPSLEKRQRYWDHLRYFGGIPAFSLRKHYTDHWVKLAPAPLVPVKMAECASTRNEHVEIDPERFKKSRGFNCPLFGEDVKTFDHEFLDPNSLRSCAQKITRGYYVIFAIPTVGYEKRYLKGVGPMGLVHAMLLDLSRGEEATVIHASTVQGRVVEEPLGRFLEKSRAIHKGYVIYEIDPEWRPVDAKASEFERFLRCERSAPSS